MRGKVYELVTSFVCLFGNLVVCTIAAIHQYHFDESPFEFLSMKIAKRAITYALKHGVLIWQPTLFLAQVHGTGSVHTKCLIRVWLSAQNADVDAQHGVLLSHSLYGSAGKESMSKKWTRKLTCVYPLCTTLILLNITHWDMYFALKASKKDFVFTNPLCLQKFCEKMTLWSSVTLKITSHGS